MNARSGAPSINDDAIALLGNVLSSSSSCRGGLQLSGKGDDIHADKQEREEDEDDDPQVFPAKWGNGPYAVWILIELGLIPHWQLGFVWRREC